MRTVAAALVSLFLLGCASSADMHRRDVRRPTAEAFDATYRVDGPQKIEPLPNWETFFDQTLDCVQQFEGAVQHDDFGDLTFYDADAIVLLESGNRPEGIMLGAYRTPDEIFLTNGKYANWKTLKHEFTHYIMNAGHNDPWFGAIVFTCARWEGM